MLTLLVIIIRFFLKDDAWTSDESIYQIGGDNSGE